MGSVIDFRAARSARIVRRALKQVQGAASEDFFSACIEADADRIERVRRIVLDEEVQRALRFDNEPVCVAYLDTIRAIVFRRTDPRTLLSGLRSVLDQPVLNKVLGPPTLSHDPNWLTQA